MRFLITAVGRAKAGPERALYEHFAGRLQPPPELREVEEKRQLDTVRRIASEGEKLLANVPEGAIVIALDETGRALASADLARRIGRWRDDGVGTIAFLIGGADGHDAAVRARADLTLAFGPATWPHMMVRGMLTEQLYRAQCILDGHPYHRA